MSNTVKAKGNIYSLAKLARERLKQNNYTKVNGNIINTSTTIANYISKPNVKQPILTQYCDGRSVTCPGWLSQWGSKYLGDINYSTIEILRNYYGSDIYINTAEEIAGIPASWPRMNLEVGARGEKVRQMQEQLLRISQSYPAIPRIVPDGVYGQQTSEAVRIFQQVFNLPATGIVDYATWYKISQIYVGVTGIGELYP